MFLFIFTAGTPFPCSLCKVTAVPQYHLAMVDGTIRNFCSYDCVSIYRVKAPVAIALSKPCLHHNLTLLLFFLDVSLENWAPLSARPDQWNLLSQGPLHQRCSQTRALCWCQLSSSHSSGLPIFSPLPRPSSQSYLSAPSRASLHGHVLPLCPRASTDQSAPWSVLQNNRRGTHWHLQTDLPSVQQTLQQQANAIQSPSKEHRSKACVYVDTQQIHTWP